MSLRLLSFLKEFYLSVFHHMLVFVIISYALSSPSFLVLQQFHYIIFEFKDVLFEYLAFYTD